MEQWLTWRFPAVVEFFAGKSGQSLSYIKVIDGLFTHNLYYSPKFFVATVYAQFLRRPAMLLLAGQRAAAEIALTIRLFSCGV